MPKSSPTLPLAQALAPSHGDHRLRPGALLDDIQASAMALSSDLAAALVDRIEELATSHHEFRRGMNRAFVRVLTLAQRQDKRVLVFDDVLPGFKLILIKKEPTSTVWKRKGAEPELGSTTAPEAQAAAALIAQFVKSTGNRVLLIESADGLFMFFPAEDLRKNLREMDLYFTDRD